MELVKKTLELMERHGIAYVLFLSDKTLVMDPDAEDVHEFPATNQVEIYRSLIVKAPFVRMKDTVITVAKKPLKEPFSNFRGL